MQVTKEKEKHILQLRMYESPKLVAELAAREAAATKARPAVDAAVPGGKGPGAGNATARGTAGDEDSGGSGLFDDVGDDYEVDTSALKKRQAAKGSQKVRSACRLYWKLLLL